MKLDINTIQKNLLTMPFAYNIKSFIIYGSSVNRQSHLKEPNDIDMCIVLRNRDMDINELSKFLYSNFEKPDFVIYYEDEINSSLPFRDTGVGSFCIEFFANGVLVHGENIFKEKLQKLDRNKYKQSHLEKVFEYILRIRRTYYSNTLTLEEKVVFLEKYVTRLIRGVLLYYGYATYMSLEKMQKVDIYILCKKLGIISGKNSIIFTSADDLYKIFEEVNLYVVTKNSCKSFYSIRKSKKKLLS